MHVPYGASKNTWCYDCVGWKSSYQGSEKKGAYTVADHEGKFRLTMLGEGDVELRSLVGNMPAG